MILFFFRIQKQPYKVNPQNNFKMSWIGTKGRVDGGGADLTRGKDEWGGADRTGGKGGRGEDLTGEKVK